MCWLVAPVELHYNVRSRVDGKRILFQLRDIGDINELKSKGVMKLCLKNRVFSAVCKDSKGRKVYCIDYEIVSCVGDDEIVNMFIERIRKCQKGI